MRATLVLQPDSRPQPTITEAFARFSYLHQISIDIASAPTSANTANTSRTTTGTATATSSTTTTTIISTERVRLDADGKAQIVAEDMPDNGTASVRIESSQGEIVWPEHNFTLTRSRGEARGVLTYSPKPVTDAVTRPATPPVPVLNRTGQFRRTGGAQRSFDRSKLQVAILTAAPRADAFPVDGHVPDAAQPFTRILDREALATFVQSQPVFAPADLKSDGGFAVRVNLPAGAAGWIWLLIEEPVSYAGWIPEAHPDQPREPFLILLPPIEETATAPSQDDDDDTASATPATVTDCACLPAGPPLDFDEEQVLRDPSVFSDDPGRYCAPFENPQRIVGERRFMTVFRVDQPEVSGAASAVHDTLPLSNLIPANATNRLAIARSFTAAPVVLDLFADPDRVLALRASGSGRKAVSARNAIQWESESSLYQASTVAGGHILEWAVRYRSNGYSLGNVAYTLTLAPRQKRRIVRVSWERRERAVRRERTTFAEQVEQSTTRDRDYNNAVRSSLREWSRGSSESSTTGAAGGIGFALGPVVIGGGAAHGTASSSASQSGGRDLAASEEQNLRDAIRQYGDSLRQFESTVVQEVTQEEQVEGVSEVVYNINYCHSLTVLYHQILRHLRIDTELAGVRECLFVPFAIRPFNVVRALQWRDLLRLGVRGRDYRYALDYLDEVTDNFVDSGIPEGPRSIHPVRFITGSIFIRLGIERPTDNADRAESEWSRFAALFSIPWRQAFERLVALEKTRRDAQFQREVAPTMAVRWADRLRIEARNGPLATADFTLATTYTFNRTVRVDFTVTVPDGTTITRDNLTQITVHAQHPLPKGSVANLERLEITYETENFTRSISSARTTNDLIDVDTGNPDPGGAVLSLPLNQWERQDERLQIRKSVDRLIAHLNANIEYYHKTIWWNLDRDRLYMMLDGFVLGDGDGRSIASVVDREPIAILGNSLVYPVSAGAFVGVGGHKTPKATLDYYRQSDRPRDPVRISLPTEGLYAQAIIDRCNATEQHQGGHDWVLSQSEPELQLLSDELLGSRRAEPTGTTPTQFPGTIINLQNAPDAPPTTGLASVLGAITSADSFRDITGLAGTQANALGALQAAAGLAESFGQKALDLRKAEQGTKMAEQRLANIRRARDEGLIDQQQASELSRSVLSEQNTTAPDSRLSQEPAVDRAITNAAARGTPIEVTRTSASGTERVAVNQLANATASLREPLRTRCGFTDGITVVTESVMRDTIAAAASDEIPNWRNGAAVVLEDDAAKFGHLVRYWLGAESAIFPSTLRALQANAIDPARNYGALVAATPTNAALSADVVRIRGELLAGAPSSGTPANLITIIDRSLRRARSSFLDTGGFTAWSAVFVCDRVRSAVIDVNLETDTSGTHNGADLLLRGTFRHSEYVLDAFNRRRLGRDGGYHAFAPNERAVQVGDIVVLDRQAANAGNVVAFRNIPTTLQGGRNMHGDIVVSIDETNHFAEAVGGNVGDTVRRRRYPLTDTGQLLVAANQLFTEEADDGTLANPPVAAAAGTFGSNNTGRIFALLSLEQECFAIPPGQETGEGILV